MLVKDWMSTDVVTVEAGETVHEAAKIFMQHNPSLLPVVRNGKAVGVMTYRDLQKIISTGDPLIDPCQIPLEVLQQRVDTIMAKSIIAVPPDYTVEETSQLLLEKRIPGCPVLDHEGRVVGIITKKDLLKAFTETSGLPGMGVLLGFLVEDRRGRIDDLLRVLRSHDARLVAIMSSYANAPEGFRNLYIRCFHIDRRRIQEIRTQLGEKAKILFIVDRKEGTREIVNI